MYNIKILLPGMDKKKKLAAINAKYEKECRCALREQATQAVVGEGNADAEMLFIGEAPGKKEDEQGKPFIGAAGKFLSEMLGGINLKREDIYITNIVKYRPPDNRDPSSGEIAACIPWLYGQIRIIRPKIIVTLGRHAMEQFIPGKKISEAHGQVFRREIDGIGEQVFYVLYHPAAALYNGSLRATLIEDFKRIPKIIEERGKTKD